MTKPRVRTVVYVHQDGILSGSAISLSNLIRALDRTKFEPHVVIGREGQARDLFAPIAETVRMVPVEYFGTQPSPPIWTPEYFRNFKALRSNPAMVRYLRELSPDLVHVNDKAALSAGRAAAKVGIPVVWHLRSAYAGGNSRMQNAMSRMIIQRNAGSVIAISEDELEGFDHQVPAHIIYNTVDLNEASRAASNAGAMRRALGIGEDEVAIGMVGLLNDQKGAWDFIRAAGEVKRRRPARRFRFVMIAPIPGEEPVNWGWRGRLGLMDKTHPMDRVRQLAREAEVTDELLLTGRRDDVMGVVAAMDIASVCYNMMAVGRPAFESMAVGRPVVVNAGHSGLSRIVRDGETGLIVPRADPVALAEAFVRLADDSDLRVRLGAQGYQHAREHFDAAINARRVEAIYEDLLRGSC